MSVITETKIMDRIIISDINLAAALATIGVPFKKFDDGSDPFVKVQTKNGVSYNFFFEVEFNGERTQDYVDAWFDDSYIENNQESQFAAVKGYNMNRNFLLDVVKKSHALVVMEVVNKNGKKSQAIISTNLPEEDRQKVLNKL